ncbi:MAG: LEA type 2 family protein, partial [Syntrophaceae bacterium]|nr:LEA type 2 family protein [Syntrophaceae bacterium]
PRFGETTVSVPVSIPLFRIARQTVGVITSEYSGKLEYEMTGKLAGQEFDSVRFSSKGVLTLPSGLSEGGN